MARLDIQEGDVYFHRASARSVAAKAIQNAYIQRKYGNESAATPPQQTTDAGGNLITPFYFKKKDEAEAFFRALVGQGDFTVLGPNQTPIFMVAGGQFYVANDKGEFPPPSTPEPVRAIPVSQEGVYSHSENVEPSLFQRIAAAYASQYGSQEGYIPPQTNPASGITEYHFSSHEEAKTFFEAQASKGGEFTILGPNGQPAFKAESGRFHVADDKGAFPMLSTAEPVMATPVPQDVETTPSASPAMPVFTGSTQTDSPSEPVTAETSPPTQDELVRSQKEAQYRGEMRGLNGEIENLRAELKGIEKSWADYKKLPTDSVEYSAPDERKHFETFEKQRAGINKDIAAAQKEFKSRNNFLLQKDGLQSDPIPLNNAARKTARRERQAESTLLAVRELTLAHGRVNNQLNEVGTFPKTEEAIALKAKLRAQKKEIKAKIEALQPQEPASLMGSTVPSVARSRTAPEGSLLASGSEASEKKQEREPLNQPISVADTPPPPLSQVAPTKPVERKEEVALLETSIKDLSASKSRLLGDLEGADKAVKEKQVELDTRYAELKEGLKTADNPALFSSKVGLLDLELMECKAGKKDIERSIRATEREGIAVIAKLSGLDRDSEFLQSEAVNSLRTPAKTYSGYLSEHGPQTLASIEKSAIERKDKFKTEHDKKEKFIDDAPKRESERGERIKAYEAVQRTQGATPPESAAANSSDQIPSGPSNR